MFNKTEIKEFIIKSGKRWLFPDFTNKLTWFVAGIGGTILVTPVALKHIFYNILVDTVNLNPGISITLAEIESSSADYLLGFWLVILALMHNIANRYLTYKTDLIISKNREKLIAADQIIFQRFMSEFHPSSPSVRFLRDVNISGGYHNDEIKELKLFGHTWDITDCEFHDQAVEKIKKLLFEKSRTFLWKLGQNSYDIDGSSRYRCIPDQYRNEHNYPPEVEITLNELNEMATEVYELHSELVRTARRNLLC